MNLWASLGAGDQAAETPETRVADAQTASEAGCANLIGLHPMLLEIIRDDLLAHGTRDDVAALRSTCKALRQAIAPTGEGGKDELTPAGATVSVPRLQWAIGQCGWPEANGYDDWGEKLPYHKVKICPCAAYVGHLEVLKWAIENGAPSGEEQRCICEEAALGGQLEVLKWARKNGFPWDYYTCSNAATKGHLELLQWARQNGARWDRTTCTYAAQKGHLELLKWARQNGAPWDKFICGAMAAHEGHLDVADYVNYQDTGPPGDVDMTEENQYMMNLIQERMMMFRGGHRNI